MVWSCWASVCTAPGSTPALPSGLALPVSASTSFLAVDRLRSVTFHFVQCGDQDARVGGEVMNHVNATAGEGVESGWFALIHRLRQILEQVLARIA
jgi:hypothetical protein